MKRRSSALLILCLLALSSFIKDTMVYEQIAFEYFVSDILKSDFKDLKSLEFKGTSEESYSTLGKYNFCLKPVDKLATIIGDAAKGVSYGARKINSEDVGQVKIVDFQSKAKDPRLFIYPSLHVADNYYVFISLQRLSGNPIKYIIEMRPDGNISRTCKTD